MKAPPVVTYHRPRDHEWLKSYGYRKRLKEVKDLDRAISNNTRREYSAAEVLAATDSAWSSP